MSDKSEIVEQLASRMQAMEAWLTHTGADVLESQKHLDHSAAESMYWHSGYHRAVCDLMPLLRELSVAPRT